MPRIGHIAAIRPVSPSGLATGLFCAATACSPGLPTPELRSMFLDYGYNGTTTDVAIYGVDLYPTVSVRPGDELEWDREFQAWLLDDEGGEHRLDGVSFRDYDELGATVPAGLDPGLYDLRVQTPDGAEVELPDAFQVTSTAVTSLLVSPDDASLAVGEYAVLEIQAVDSSGALVEEALPVSVELTAGSDLEGVSFAAQPALDGQTELDDGVGVQGWLEPTGIGYVALTSSSPANLSVVIDTTEADSRVSSAVSNLSFDPGPVSAVRVTLPEIVAVTAGVGIQVTVELLDENDNPTPDTQALLYLHETCPGGTYSETQYVIGSLTVEAVVTGATNRACSSNSIQVQGVADGNALAGESETFQVLPGTPTQLDVTTSPHELTAGEETLYVAVAAEDAWGNVASNYLAGLSLTDSAGGLDPGADIGVQSCADFSGDLAITFCQARLWATGDEVTITAKDEFGLVGTSDPISVIAGSLDSVGVSMSTTEVTAGVDFTATVIPRDEYGNAILLEPGLLGTVHFYDDSGELSCDRDTADADLSDGADYACVIRKVDGADALRVVLSTPDLELSDLSAAFEVVNGALYEVSFDLGGVDPVVAGEGVTVQISGSDACGNAYVHGTDHLLTLSDDTGTLSLSGGGTTVTLGTDGTTTATLTFTEAMEGDQILAEVGGTTFGPSDPFDIIAGPLAGFVAEMDTTWVWVGEPLEVRVRAEDDWGNAVTDYDDEATLRSEGGYGDAVSASDWADGVLTVDFAYDTWAIADRLEVLFSGAVAATTEPVDALIQDCPDGPTADLLVAGSSTTTLCLSGGRTPSATVSAVGSSPGSATIAGYHYDLGDGDWSRSSAATRATRWTEEGGYRASVVVADSRGCGDEASALVYVAEADGRPAGPLTVTLDDDTLNAGADEAVATIEATDCAGDPADGELLAWADLGDVESGPTSVVSATGEGLGLDVVHGGATLTWSMLSDLYDGTATLHVGAASGAAYGEAEATVSGDQARPLVLSMSPVGTWTSPFSSIALTFSEPIDESSLSRKMPTLVNLADSTYLSISDLALDADRTTLTIDLASAFTPGSVALTVPRELRDDAGNRLNGAWDPTGAASDFTLTFGAVTDEARDLTGCEPTVDSFYPDGDPGSGGVGDAEADEVSVLAYTDDTPTWWRLEVTDDQGEVILVDRVHADTSSDALPWDGRGIDGKIADPGEYTLTVTAEDDAWNTGTSCSTTVELSQRVRAVP